MQIFFIKLRIFLTLSQIDSSLFDGVMKIFVMPRILVQNITPKSFSFLENHYYFCFFKKNKTIFFSLQSIGNKFLINPTRNSLYNLIKILKLNILQNYI